MRNTTILAVTSVALTSTLACAQWVNYVNETSTRLVASPSLVVNTNLEHDFGWADFDKDGDIDLVVARKFPGSVQGGFRGILFMNEGGVLVDRTVEYASASNVAGQGYQGLLDPCNTRDITPVDVDGDGWLDLVTATTMSDGLNIIIGQPRVYMNLGNDANGNWLGFRHEHGRIPQLFARNGNVANPRFCDSAIADYNGDGYPDIFYTDYDTPETGGQTICLDLNNDGDTSDPGECQFSPTENPANDFDNKLLLNYGAANPGYFYDATSTVLTSAQMTAGFGASAVAADMNGDGLKDIVWVNTLTSGQNVQVFVQKTDMGAAQRFTTKEATAGAPYHANVVDLNGDGRLDIVVADDSQDKYLINTGNNASGQPNFTSYTITESPSQFDSTIQFGDLDNDGRPDAIIVDVDIDLGPFCPTTGRRSYIWRNVYSGNNNGILSQNGSTTLPTASLVAWTDAAIFDINGDGWLDIVAGRCAGIEVWMNKPPISLTFSYPTGLPVAVAPGEATAFSIKTAIEGGGSIVAGTAKINWQVNGGDWQSTLLADLGANSWTATLPAFDCGNSVRYYVSAELSNLGLVKDPATAPTTAYTLTIETDTADVFYDDIEGDVSGWTVVNQGALTSGAWQAVTPIGTVNGGQACAPANDASLVGTKAWVTQNGAVGGAAAASDVDGGITRLISPAINLEGAAGATLRYARWYYCNDTANATEVDPLLVEVSNDDGNTWVLVEEVKTANNNQWKLVSVNLADHFTTLTANMRVRFSISDVPENSITEAAIDEVQVIASLCNAAAACPGDLNGDSVINGADLGLLLSAWGNCSGACSADLNGDSVVNGADLGLLLSAWGACP